MAMPGDDDEPRSYWPEAESNVTGLPQKKPQPSNIPVEQAFLGAILVNNKAAALVRFVQPDHFFEPVHGRIWAAAIKLIDRGMLASPVTLYRFFGGDAGLKDVGGGKYLAKLAAALVSVIDVTHYGNQIVECWQLRQGIATIEEGLAELYDTSLDDPASGRVAALATKLERIASAQTELAGRPTAIAAFEQLEVDLAREARGERAVGRVMPGLAPLDDLLGGMDPGELLVLGGRPSMGKTALGMWITTQAAAQAASDAAAELPPWQVAYFSYEMTTKQLIARQIAARTGIPFNRILGKRAPRLTDDELAQVARERTYVAGLPLLLDGSVMGTMADLRARALGWGTRTRLGLIVVDHLLLIKPSREAGRTLSRTDQVGEVTHGLKALAKELQCPILALCQLSRAAEDDAEPTMRHLRSSGDIEQDADVVLLLHRPEYYAERKSPGTRSFDETALITTRRGMVKILAPKVRDSEAKGVTAHCDLATNRWAGWSDDTGGPLGPEPPPHERMEGL